MVDMDPAYEAASELISALENGDKAAEERFRHRLATVKATTEDGRLAQAVEARKLFAELAVTLAAPIAEKGLQAKARALTALLGQLLDFESSSAVPAERPRPRLATRNGHVV